MPLNPNLDINYTPVQKTAIETALDTSNTELVAVIVDPLNLSADERQSTPSVDAQREPFVNDAVNVLSLEFPNLLGPEITPARAAKLWEFRTSSLEILAQVDKFRDQLTDAIINAENICLKFTEDFRGNAQRFKDRNVPGADVAWERLKDLHVVTPNPDEPPAPDA